MKKSNPRVAVITTVTSLFLMWVLFFAAQSFLVRPTNTNANYVPTNTNFALRIDGKKLVAEGFRALFLADETESQALLEKLLNQSKKQNKDLQLGLNLLSDVYLFEEEFHGHEISGVLLNLRDSKQFKKNIGSHLNKGQVFSSNDEVAVILFSSDKDNIKSSDLQVHADMILQESNKVIENLEKESNLIDISFSKPQRSEFASFESGALNINIRTDTVITTGTIEFEKSIKPLLNHKIDPKGFHATINSLSEPLRDSLSSVYDIFNLGNRIDGISLNYYGLEIKEVPRLYFLPKFDAVFHFENPITQKTFVDSLAHADVFDTIMPNKFVYGEQNYFYKFFDQKTVYIGTNKPVNNVNPTKDLIFHLEGDASKLTNLEGTGMMRKFVEIVSFFAASKNLFGAIEELDIKIIGNDQNNLSGIVVCKNEQSALRLITQFLFDANIIR